MDVGVPLGPNLPRDRSSLAVATPPVMDTGPKVPFSVMSTRLIKILHKSVNKICSLLTWDGFDFTGTHALV